MMDDTNMDTEEVTPEAPMTDEGENTEAETETAEVTPEETGEDAA